MKEFLLVLMDNVLATRSGQPPGRATFPGPLFQVPEQRYGQLPGLIFALTTASDTQMPSELNVEERIQLAIKALQDGTGPSQRRAAYLYNVPRTTLQARFHGRRSAKESQQSQQRLSVQEQDSVKRCILTMASWGWPVSIKYLQSLTIGLLRAKGDHEPLGQHWYKNLLARHSDLKAAWSRSLVSSSYPRWTHQPCLLGIHSVLYGPQDYCSLSTTSFNSCPAASGCWSLLSSR